MTPSMDDAPAPRPAAWEKARVRFRGGYGCEVDLSDPTDAWLFVPLLEAEIRDEIAREMTASFRRWTAEVLEETRLLETKLRDEKRP